MKEGGWMICGKGAFCLFTESKGTRAQPLTKQTKRGCIQCIQCKGGHGLRENVRSYAEMEG